MGINLKFKNNKNEPRVGEWWWHRHKPNNKSKKSEHPTKIIKKTTIKKRKKLSQRRIGYISATTHPPKNSKEFVSIHNPNPKDNRTAYLNKHVREDKPESFRAKIPYMRVDRKDKNIFNQIKNNYKKQLKKRKRRT